MPICSKFFRRQFAVIIFGLALFGAIVPRAKANISDCDQVVGNLVQNCGFEGGTYSSTIGGNTNNGAPASWAVNAAFDLEPGFNFVTSNPPNVHSGSSALSIGNFDSQPTPTISQTITDVSGATYTGSFWAYAGDGGDSNAFLQLQVDGVNKVTLDDTVNSYAEYGFTFTGTGSDTLSIGAVTNPGEWYVDDVVVTGQLPGTTVTPEPSELAPLALGVVFLLVVAIRKGKTFSSARVKAS
jgi:hypothetical protein